VAWDSACYNWAAMTWTSNQERSVGRLSPRLLGLEEFWTKIGFAPDEKQRELLEARGRRVILNCTRQWGKSTVTAARAVWQAYTQPASLTLVLSPSARQSSEFLRKAAGFTRGLGFPAKSDGNNEISLQYPNGSRIVGLPGSEAKIRGFSAAGLILIDEAARVPDELYLSVRPMLAVKDGDLWLMSTSYGKRGFFYETWAKGGPEWLRLRVTASECPRIKPEFLEEERRAMGERYFQQEYFCNFSERNDSVFRDDDIMAALDYSLEPLKVRR
jgi:hypothetical protein